ncbi:MAG: hypothetical protein CM1200mP3_05610 [Chloroflexota bacterium]|nr:MAG: hypothetical protein CM1200mP3_05610 [Chloroflexota bacterium]
MDKDNTIFGWETPNEIPSTALESNPGDVVLFNQCIFHAALEAKRGPRMVAKTWASSEGTWSVKGGIGKRKVNKQFPRSLFLFPV